MRFANQPDVVSGWTAGRAPAAPAAADKAKSATTNAVLLFMVVLLTWVEGTSRPVHSGGNGIFGIWRPGFLLNL
jgi:hypothetical protein